MQKEKQKSFCIAVCLLTAFVLWTLAVRFVDVQTIGPQNTTVGFASLNQFIHTLFGVHLTLYTLTDWLSLLPLGFVLGFACLGLVQWIRRKHFFLVDRSILILGVFYVIVMAAFCLFEVLVINYRPVLIDGHLEASYPSSTTLLVLCVMPTAAMQLRMRIKNRSCRQWFTFLITVFTAFMVIARLISGVHWFTDIIGGILLSTGLVSLYYAIITKAKL